MAESLKSILLADDDFESRGRELRVGEQKDVTVDAVGGQLRGGKL